MSASENFVADGYQRAYRASYAVISAELKELYADRFKLATFWERIQLRREMKREITERLERIAPRDALY